MRHSRIIVLCCVTAIAHVSPVVVADEDIYLSAVRPVLRERCWACHGSLKQESGLRLDTGAAIRTGTDNGAVIDVTNAEASELIRRLTSKDEDRMPPIGKPLGVEEITAIRDWIAQGAISPEDEEPESDPSDHWSFRILQRPEVPHGDGWAGNQIDRFLASRRSAAGLSPVPDADPAHLLRRVTLDLTGLPPTPDKLRTFLHDPSPEHYLQIVDELLASPQYGERWARHWMDVWRYSDWYGRRDQHDVRNSAPQIWRWRDWIIQSLNDDKSYARMIQEMLAADEIAAEDDTAWPATGYLIRSYYSLNPNEWMRHNVEYTGKAFLGLTFNCAHCHDHKYDPIAHDDYFRFRAFFEPMGIRQDRVVGEPDPPPFEPYVYSGSRKVVRTGMVRIYDEKPEAPTWFYTGGDERNRLSDRGSIPPGVPEFLNIPFPKISAIELPQAGWYPGARPNLRQAMLDECVAEIHLAEQGLQDARTRAVDTSQWEQNLQNAREQFDAALQAAVAAGEQGALSGSQSLLMDVPSGRRTLQQHLTGLKSLPTGTTVEFTLRILQDGHFNFQLAKDARRNATALWFAFAGGKIETYRPGGFSVFQAGSYDAENPPTVRCRLSIDPVSDSASLLIQPLKSTELLVDDVTIALNGWDPSKRQHQPFTLDCQAGTRVLLDDLRISIPAGESNAAASWSWDFEPEFFEDGRDIVGTSGWDIHQLSNGPGISIASSAGGCMSAQPTWEKLRAARIDLHTATHRVRTAELRLKSARKALTSLQSVIAADEAEREKAAAADRERLARKAYADQLESDEARAVWQIEYAGQELTHARQQVDDQTKKDSTLKSLHDQLTAAKKNLRDVQQRRINTPTSTEYRRLSPTTGKQSTGRRSALAAWITHPNNPLTPRVAVNHLWTRHFHQPLVDSVYDFGRNGKEPTHPQLLDWLAVELQEHDWSMKHLHRLIVTSRTYQMSSSANGAEDHLTSDPENRLLWRMNTGRMESEVIRDSILSIAGRLDSTVGGEVLANTTAMITFRRSLYYEIYPEGGGSEPLGEVFDAPDPGECFRRTATVVPQQALALSNSKIIHQSAAATVKVIEEMSSAGHHAFADAAFRRILNRPPTTEEIATAVKFLETSGSDTREALIRVLFNHNDFVSIR